MIFHPLQEKLIPAVEYFWFHGSDHAFWEGYVEKKKGGSLRKYQEARVPERGNRNPENSRLLGQEARETVVVNFTTEGGREK